jgi:hypothetical protein
VLILSCALILQEKKRIFIAVDSAISCKYNDKNYRLHDNGLKHLIINNEHFIFATGEVKIVNDIFNDIKKQKNITPLKISIVAQKYNKKYKNKKFEIIYLKTSLTNIKLYQIYKENNFTPILHNAIDNLIKISSVGFLTKEIISKAGKYLSENKDIVNLMLNSFKDINCNEVGGLISIYSITDKIELLNKTKLSNQHIEYLINDNQHYIYANSLYSEIIVSSNLTIRTTDNSTTINTNGITVTKSDEKVRTLLNATDGIKIQTTSVAGNWGSAVDVFSVDTNGNLRAVNLIIDSGVLTDISNGDNSVLIGDSGITVTRDDEKLRILLNGTDGIKIQTTPVAGSWGSAVDVFKVNTAGVVYARDFIILDGSGNDLFVSDTGIMTNGTIIGGVFKTAASGRRIELNSATNSLIMYNASGGRRISINYNDNELFEFYDDFAIDAASLGYNSTYDSINFDVTVPGGFTINNRKTVRTSSLNDDIFLQLSGTDLQYYNGSTWVTLATV